MIEDRVEEGPCGAMGSTCDSQLVDPCQVLVQTPSKAHIVFMS